MAENHKTSDSQREKKAHASSSSSMNYTRKRVLVACEFCRHRKRRCDGGRPSCTTCIESNADCVYKEHPPDRVESSSPSAVAERLGRIEQLLEEHTQRLEDIAQGTVSLTRATSIGSLGSLRGLALSGPSLPNQPALSPLDVSSQILAVSPSPSNRSMVPETNDSHLDQTHFLIPQDHSGSGNALLRFPDVRAFLGDYPRDYLFKLDEHVPLPPGLDPFLNECGEWPNLPDSTVLKTLAHRYFAHVHPNFPLFTRQQFDEWQAQLFETGPQETLEVAICFCIYALGCLVSLDDSNISPDLQRERDNLALQFLRPCLRITLRHLIWKFSPSVRTCQALLLCTAYFSLMGRPLHAWQMIRYTAAAFFMIMNQQRRVDPPMTANDEFLRVFWTCFMIESDCAAELDIHRSGIEPLADRIPLPRGLDQTEQDDIHYFVAETALRRMLNRIYCLLYAVDGSHDGGDDWAQLRSHNNLNTLLALSSELDRQLEEWYNSIPHKIRPPNGTGPVANDRGKVLRIRYYVAKHLIHRPFVLYLALQQSATLTGGSSGSGSIQPPHLSSSRLVLDKCETCIASSRAYLYNVAEMLGRRSPYLWTYSQNCLAGMLVLAIAQACPSLYAITPDIRPLYALIIPKLQRWADKGSSFEAVVTILQRMNSRDGGAPRPAWQLSEVGP